MLLRGRYNAPEGNPGPPTGTAPLTPNAAPAATIPVVGPQTDERYVSREDFNSLRDLVNGLQGNLSQVRQTTADGIRTITTQLSQLAQPQVQTPAPAQTPAPEPTTPQPQAVATSVEQELRDLRQRVQTSERLTRLTIMAPELAANQDVVSLITNSTLEDDALFNIIGGLRSTLAVQQPSNEGVGDIVTPPTAGTETPAPDANTSEPGSTNPPVALGNNPDIPDGVPPVNNPFPVVGETVGEQLRNLVNSGDMEATAALIEEQLASGTLQPNLTMGQNQRAIRNTPVRNTR